MTRRRRLEMEQRRIEGRREEGGGTIQTAGRGHKDTVRTGKGEEGEETNGADRSRERRRVSEETGNGKRRRSRIFDSCCLAVGVWRLVLDSHACVV